MKRNHLSLPLDGREIEKENYFYFLNLETVWM